MADNTAGQTRVVSNDQVTGQFAAGKITYEATAITTTDYTRVECGFQPRYIEFENLTDRIKVEWQEGFTSAQCLKTAAAGTRTLDTTAGAVSVDTTPGFQAWPGFVGETGGFQAWCSDLNQMDARW